MTSMKVEEAVMAVTLDGGLAGATNNPRHYKSNFKKIVCGSVEGKS